MNGTRIILLAPLLILSSALPGWAPAGTSAGPLSHPAIRAAPASGPDMELWAEGQTGRTPAASSRPAEAEAGCEVNIRGRNGGTRKIYTLFFRTTTSGLPQVRTRLGIWKNITIGDAILPGETFQRVVKLDFYCNAHRRYRFRLEQDGSGLQHTFYYPSSSTFTAMTTIDLGDVNRFF